MISPDPRDEQTALRFVVRHISVNGDEEAEADILAALSAVRQEAQQEIAEARRAYAICSDHQPDRWTGDGTCVICEGDKLHSGLTAARQEIERLRAALQRICVNDWGHDGGSVIKGNTGLAGGVGEFNRAYNAGIESQFAKTAAIAEAALAGPAAPPQEQETK